MMAGEIGPPTLLLDNERDELTDGKCLGFIREVFPTGSLLMKNSATIVIGDPYTLGRSAITSCRGITLDTKKHTVTRTTMWVCRDSTEYAKELVAAPLDDPFSKVYVAYII